jgi:hypothetical protein
MSPRTPAQDELESSQRRLTTPSLTRQKQEQTAAGEQNTSQLLSGRRTRVSAGTRVARGVGHAVRMSGDPFSDRFSFDARPPQELYSTGFGSGIGTK